MHKAGRLQNFFFGFVRDVEEWDQVLAGAMLLWWGMYARRGNGEVSKL
jgi:hypothetical protein